MAERKLSGMQKLGLAMAAFGQGMTGQPFASNIMGNWQKQDELAAEQAYRQWQMKQQERELATTRQKIMMDAWKARKDLENDATLKKAQADYYTSMAGLVNRGGADFGLGVGQDQTTPIDPTQAPQTFLPDDYQVSQQVRNIRGVPTVMSVPTLKPSLDDDQSKTINTATNLLTSLNQANDLSKGGVKTGFDTLFNEAIPFNYKMLKQFGDEKSQNLAQILKQVQSSYITSQTGAQRGFKEMTWYEPSMPTGDMSPDKLQSVIQNTNKLTELNIRNLLITAKKSGKRIGDYRELYDGLVKKYPLEEYPYGMKQSDVLSKLGGIPQYNPKTQRLQRNSKTGEYRVIPLR